MAELSELIRANDVAAVAAERDFLRASVKPWEGPETPAAQGSKILEQVLAAMTAANGDRSKLWFISARVNAELPPYRQSCGMPPPAAPPDQKVEMEIEERWQRDRDWAVAFFAPAPAPESPTQADTDDVIDRAFGLLDPPAASEPAAAAAPQPEERPAGANGPQRHQPLAARPGCFIVGKERHEVRIDLTPAEMAAVSKKLVRKVQERADVEASKKEMAAEFKAKLEGIEASIQEHARILANGYVYEERDCRVVVKGETATIERLDNGEVVRTRPATDSERQATIPGAVL